LLIGLGGNDRYVINSANDDIVEIAGGGTDDRAQVSVSFALAAGDNIEVLQTTNAGLSGALNLSGNGIAQSIYGNAGINTLNGGVDALKDTLIGYGGDDTYIINSAIDDIVEAAGGGTADRVRATVSFVLGVGDNIEILETAHANLATAINLTGNEIVQSVTGNAGVNTLNGGLGNDTLTGLGGADNFLFNTAAGVANMDIITDFNVAADTIQLENAVFAGLGAALGTLDTTMFKNLTTGGPVDVTDRILYNDATGALFYDSDGSGAAAAVQFATLTGSPTVFFDDFVVV
jgi:serralysin